MRVRICLAMAVYLLVIQGGMQSQAQDQASSIAGWGDNRDGQAAPPAGNDFVAIAAGGDHSLALKADGSIVSWGDNTSGKATPPAGNDFVAIAAGTQHSLALKADGSVVGWGRNTYGQTTVPAGNDFVAIAAGGSHSLALKADGSVVGWGFDADGQATPPAGYDFVAIAAGGWHSLALKADGSVVGWGYDGDGQATPPAGYDLVAVSAGGEHSLVLKADGSIVAWGHNNGGQAVAPAGNDFVAIAAGGWHNLALKADGSVIGDVGWPTGQATAPASNDFQAIAAGSFHNLAIKETQIKYPHAHGPEPADGGMHEDTWVALSWRSWRPREFAVSHNVYFGDNFDDVNNGTGDTFRGNQASTSYAAGFPGFAIPDGFVPGMTYYWRIDEVNETQPNSPWKGPVWSFSIPPMTAYNPDPADGANSVEGSRSPRLTRHQLNVTLSWTAGFGSKLHTVYFGDNFGDVNNATGGLVQGATTYTAGPVEFAKTYYWRVDEFDSIATYKGDVWSLTTQGAVGNPNPSNGAVDVKQTQILTWLPGIYGASHEIYFGTGKETVRKADAGSPEYKGSGNLGSESYDPGKLEWDTTYYWRIDEVNNANTDSPWTGPVWSFATANFLVVDDFESYNDIDPPDAASNRIFDKWIDGFGTT
ncbi:MAG: RCC1 domain-containing protein, partial [Planctomycetota bacterium]